MDRLTVAPEELVVVADRNDKRIRVTHHMYDALVLLREHPKKVAASGQTVTYKDAAVVTKRLKPVAADGRRSLESAVELRLGLKPRSGLEDVLPAATRFSRRSTG